MTEQELQQLLSPKAGVDPALFHYYEGLKKRSFYFTEEVDSYMLETVGIPLMEADKKDPETPITIYINTPGGDVFSGFAICNIIENLKAPTTIVVLGYAYSMGAMMLIAGANKPNIKRQAYKFSTGLIHGGSSLISGTSSQVKDFYKFQERFEKQIEEFVIERTTLTEEEYQKVDREELYMTSQEMLDKGLIDEIV